MGTGTKLLVERAEQLERMTEVVTGSRQGGELLLVSGEAGHGKTTLIEAFEARLDHRFSVLRGACDPVSVPTPFAPLFELADSLPPDLVADVRNGDHRHRIYAAMLRILDADPTVLILEDLQWADEATLGLVRYLGRRLVRTSSILLLSYRPEEVDTTHPLLVVLADLGSLATAVTVPPLTVAGVREMAAGRDVDAARIHETTGGSPFFVEEILAHPGPDLPATIGAAVMASVAKLPTGSLDLVEMVSLSPEGLTLEMAERHSPEAARNIDAAFRRRLLVEDRGRLKCRHDLIRRAIDEAIPPSRRRRIHTRLLGDLETGGPTRHDLAALAHHAVHAGDSAKAIRYSLEAAAHAESEGANRQARLHYRAALGFREEMDTATLDRALRGAAEVSCATNHLAEATAAARDRVKLATDDHDLADRLAYAAFIASRWGNVEFARTDAERAIDLHRGFEDCPEVALARSVVALLAIWDADWRTAAEMASSTVEEAGESGSRELLASGLLGLGRAEALLGRDGWEQHLDAAVRLGEELGRLETACSGLNSLAFLPYWRLDATRARERFDTGIDFAASNEMDAWYVAMAASRVGCDLAAGDWEEAAGTLERAIAWPTCSSTDCEAKILLAMLRSRQGGAGAVSLVASALAAADTNGTYIESVLATLLALEAAWLGIIEHESAIDRYVRSMARAREVGDTGGLARLAFWAAMAGIETPDRTDAALRSEIAEWSERGFAYKARLLETRLDDPPLAAVFAWFEERGAEGVVRALRRDLRERGVEGIPMPKRSSASNPAGLTHRQLEVLGLLAAGHTNADIADELYISEKTVGHHVSAILQKLSVGNRGQAVAEANRLGLVRGAVAGR